MRALLVGVSSSLIAAGIAYWITEHKLVPAVVMAVGGIAGFLITYFFAKKRQPVANPVPIHQEVRQEANPSINVAPQQNVYIGMHSPESLEVVRDNARREAMIIEFLKKSPPYTGYDVAELANAVNITMPEVRDIVERLEARKIVHSEGSLDAVGGKAYFLDSLHRSSSAPAPAMQAEPQHNIRFDNIWYGETWQGSPLSMFAGEKLPYATVKFENIAIQGVKLATPRVKARAIYRRGDGTPILDIPQVPWIPGEGNQSHAIFAANTPQHVLLFFLGRGKTLCRCVESGGTRIAGQKRRLRNVAIMNYRSPLPALRFNY